jgi:outer membrane protein OmpA-like peptidoglycan-associated protein
MNKFLYAILLFLLLGQMGWAQAKRQLKEAETHFAYEEYALAIPLFEAYLEDEARLDKIIEISYKLGFCYLQTAQKGKALPHLELVYQQKPKYNKNLTYYLAQSYHFQHQWDKAEQFYKMAAKESEFAKDVPKHLEELNFGREYTKNPTRVVVENLGDVLNSSFPEYVPVISEDESVMLFTARRPNTTGGGKDPYDQEYFEDIYISEKKDGKWTAPKVMPRPINGNSHDACIALSPDGKTLFVYKTGSGRNKMGDIYYSKRNEDGSWSDPKSMGDKINTKYREPSISITHDGNTIYFSSDRPGGFGGLDIYKSTKNEKGEWGEPTNLGATINTPYDEDSPFIHNETTLYFSSQGHSSMGGYDVFVSELNGKEWSKPQNLGSPINTADDDIYFVVSADNKRGYFSSGRAGGLGDKDLYMIYTPERNYDFVKLSNTPTKINTQIKIDNNPQTDNKTYLTILKGEIREAATKKKLEAEIALVNLADNYLEEELKSDAQTGKYESIVPAEKHYLLSVDKEGYLFHSEEVKIPSQPKDRNQEIVVDIELVKLQKGAKINLKVFYDFDKDFLRPESVTELERLLKFLQKYPKMKVEISGHTDAVGTEAKNQGLSERRAKSVVRYLVERGIDAKRLIAKGYGEIRPIATNDTPEGRQLNRRTECEVLEF